MIRIKGCCSKSRAILVFFAVLFASGVCWAQPEPPALSVDQADAKARSIARAKAQAEADDRADDDKFIKLYPGVLSDREKGIVEKIFDENKAIEERGDIDIQALINGTLPEDTPGVGTPYEITEELVRYNNKKHAPENPIFNDAEYAKKLGFKYMQAYPTFASAGHSPQYPGAARDKLLVVDLNHNTTLYKPVYPGDTLYPVANKKYVTDLTPLEGATTRSLAMHYEGSLYNQRGEKVSDVIFRLTENIKIYKEEYRLENPSFADIWDAPEWYARPEHYYTDADWKFIKAVWSNEKRQGARPLYWEDVNIGDEPPWTLEGPIFETTQPVSYSALGAGGSRTLKKEILDPIIFKTMIRSEADGIYRLPNIEEYVPPVPGGKPANVMGSDVDTSESGAINEQDIHRTKVTRSALLNLMSREFAVRHITDWMGDHGWLYNIRWSIMDRRAHQAYGKGDTVPLNPEAEHYLDRVPYMKGKYVDAHGLTGDIALVKSYIYDKYVRDGQFYVDLVWWIETIEGDIYSEGGATVRLPSKNSH